MARYKVKNHVELEKTIINLVMRSNSKLFENLWKDLVNQTPVDTGTARYSWIFTAGRPSVKRPIKQQYSYPSLPDFWKYTWRWQNWYITNNQPYLSKLNNGHSKQNTKIGWIQSTTRKHIIIANSGGY